MGGGGEGTLFKANGSAAVWSSKQWGLREEKYQGNGRGHSDTVRHLCHESSTFKLARPMCARYLVAF